MRNCDLSVEGRGGSYRRGQKGKGTGKIGDESGRPVPRRLRHHVPGPADSYYIVYRYLVNIFRKALLFHEDQFSL